MTGNRFRLDRDRLHNPLEGDRGPLPGLAHRVDRISAEDMEDGVVPGDEEGAHVVDLMPLSSELRRGGSGASTDGLDVAARDVGRVALDKEGSPLLGFRHAGHRMGGQAGGASGDSLRLQGPPHS